MPLRPPEATRDPLGLNGVQSEPRSTLDIPLLFGKRTGIRLEITAPGGDRLRIELCPHPHALSMGLPARRSGGPGFASTSRTSKSSASGRS